MTGENKKSLLTLQQVLESTGGVHVLGSGEFCFTSVQTDSRMVQDRTLFVPLIGQAQDGHKYVPEAIEKGASVIFIRLRNFEEDGDFFASLSQNNPDVFFIGVESTLYALQRIAARYVEKFPDLIKIAVTGSSGKTTTKEILASVLGQKFSVVTNKGNLNSETGLPLSVFGINEGHKAGVFEMGMNRKDEIKEIAAVLKPRMALVTNIGTAHVGLLGSRENIAREKAMVFSHFNGIGTGVIPADDDFSDFLAEQIDGNVVRYGEGLVPGVEFVEDLGLDGTRLSVDGVEAVLHLPGKYNYRNALGAIALARILGVSAEEIARGINSLRPVSARSEVIRGKYTIMQDCYNANPDSMRKALEFVSCVPFEGKKILILGDMLELGESSAEDHGLIGELAAGGGADFVIFAGDEMSFAYDRARLMNGGSGIFHVPGNGEDSMHRIAETVRGISRGGDLVLVKGSRGMGLERVVQELEASV